MFEQTVEPTFSATRAFQETERMVLKLLDPGIKLNKEILEVLGINYFLLIGNSRLNANCFQLRTVDLLPIGGCSLPGKSITLDFWGVEKRNIPGSVKDELIRRSFGKPSDRRDNVYYAPLEQIDDVGFSIYYAPESGNGLHCRLVWKEHEKGIAEYPDETILENLVNTWSKVTISK